MPISLLVITGHLFEGLIVLAHVFSTSEKLLRILYLISQFLYRFCDPISKSFLEKEREAGEKSQNDYKNEEQIYK